MSSVTVTDIRFCMGLVMPSNLQWMLLWVQGAILLPLFAFVMPVWLSVLCGLCFVWRIAILRNWVMPPNNVFKVVLVFALSVGLMSEIRGTQFSLDITVSLLVAMFVLKTLEMHSRRDALLVLYLGFVVVASIWLHRQTLLLSVYLLMCIVALLYVLIFMHTDGNSNYAKKHASKVSVYFFFQALPVLMFLMFFMPRLPPLWSVPLSDGQSFTGMSDEMMPGQVSSLTRSDALVLRAEFERAVPATEHLYWRGLVMADFDGRRWYNKNRSSGGVGAEYPALNYIAGDQTVLRNLARRVNYRVVLEPHGERWLYGLEAVQAASNEAHISQAFTLFSPQSIVQRKQYSVTSYLQFDAQLNLSKQAFLRHTSLPRQSNPQAQALAKEWSAQGLKGQAFVDRLLKYFKQKEFYYTLQPERLDALTAIDAFLFETREGFCEHYASAFVFMLRAAGIPARVVGGYQGGTVLQDERLVTVRQFDAHAWAEWWQPNQGWVRADPTAAIAPERVRQGAIESLSGRRGFLSNQVMAVGFGKLQWMRDLRWSWDRLNYSWNSWVLQFDDSHRRSRLQRWLGGADIYSITKGFVGGVLALLLLLYISVRCSLRSGVILPKAWVRDYQRFRRRLPVTQIDKVSLAPNIWAEHACKRYPEIADYILNYVKVFNAMQYEVSEQGNPKEFQILYKQYIYAKKQLNRAFYLQIFHYIKARWFTSG